MIKSTSKTNDVISRTIEIESCDIDNIYATRYRDSSGECSIVLTVGVRKIEFTMAAFGGKYEMAAKATAEVLDAIANDTCILPHA